MNHSGLLAGAAVAILVVGGGLVFSRTAEDPDLELRGAYVQTIVRDADASAAFRLTGSDSVQFGRGWTYVAFGPGYANPMRGASRRAVLRLRAKRDSAPMRLVLRGWVAPELQQGSVVLAYESSDGPIASYQVSTQDFEHVVRIASARLPKGGGFIDVTITSSAWISSATDNGERSFNLLSLAWEEDRATADSGASPP